MVFPIQQFQGFFAIMTPTNFKCDTPREGTCPPFYMTSQSSLCASHSSKKLEKKSSINQSYQPIPTNNVHLKTNQQNHLISVANPNNFYLRKTDLSSKRIILSSHPNDIPVCHSNHPLDVDISDIDIQQITSIYQSSSLNPNAMVSNINDAPI